MAPAPAARQTSGVATLTDVRRIARALPGAIEGTNGFAFSVRRGAKETGFVWTWLERVHPRKARVPNPRVLAVRVADLVEKDSLLGLDAAKFFTEPHYDGYPAVLVRLAAVDRGELRKLVTRAWQAVAPGERVDGRTGRARAPARKAPASERRSR